MNTILGKMSIGDTVSFDLHVSSMLAQNYDHVKVVGVIPAYFGDRFGVDLYTLHAQVYRLLPPGTIEDDPTSYEYLVLDFGDNQYRVVGIPWIDDTTIRVHSETSVTFAVYGMPQESINDVRDYIARLGYTATVNVDRN